MKFHWISGTDITITTAKFGSQVMGLHIGTSRPNYVIIDKKEFEASTLHNEKAMLAYMDRIKKSLLPGGKIYLEITP